MKNDKPKYWKGLEELNREESFEKLRHKEFVEKLPLGEVLNEENSEISATRRDFLKLMGFSISAATLAACTRTPVKKVVPYVTKPDDQTIGVANYYATTCSGCDAHCSLIVKTREGRPIKIEGNPQSAFSKGGVCAVGQATVLTVYDNSRLVEPLAANKPVSWQKLDKDIKSKLSATNGAIVILTGTVTSPTTLSIIEDFKKKYPNTRHVSYDAVSSAALISAHQQAFGKAVLPHYLIDKSSMIVSFGADFLGSYISPVEFTKMYSAARKAEGDNHLYHVQFEANMSLTGSNADMRAVLAPSQYGQALLRLHNYIAEMSGGSQAATSKLELMGNSINATAKQLWKNKGKSIVMTDSNDLDHQLIVASINSMLGNYGKTIDLDNPSYQKQGNDAEMIRLVNDMNSGNVGAIFIGDVNPSYSYPDAAKFNAGLAKVPLSVSFAEVINETSAKTKYNAPNHHFLESWGDERPIEGFISLYQPTISPIFKTRAFQESMMTWMDMTKDGKPMEYYDYLRDYWKNNFFGKQSAYSDFESFWANHLHDGYLQLAENSKNSYTFSGSLNDAGSRMAKDGGNQTELVIYEKVSIRDGRNANNPWLQELPDPVTKISWDNYLCVNPKWADEKKLKDEDVVEIKSGNNKISLPIFRIPGIRYNTVAIAAGYGRDQKINTGVVIQQTGGANVFPFATIVGNFIQYKGMPVEISGKTGTYELAMTQTHHNMEGRDLVREATLEEFINTPQNQKVGSPHEQQGKAHHLLSLYKDYRFPGHHWGMAIDLNACTGCGACVVACQAENNIPVVGKDEVRRRREMHWMRIDRYFALGEVNNEPTNEQKYLNEYQKIDKEAKKGKIDFENVRVVFQPMLCQHCENAPCENVCPVNAISHSSEGLNQQIYNRCVGTRYCANNCPYKVRRFNWFNYAENEAAFPYYMSNDLGRMVLNPDVTVRIRGVMEKCSFCVQRIQLSKLEAKTDGRMLKDGEVKTACMTTCPANAIVFGDMNDPNSEISKLLQNNRTYGVLTELNTRPSVNYMAKVRNIPTEKV